MVNRKAQSLVEFLMIMALLTFVGMFLISKINPGPTGAVSTAQDAATAKIAND